MGKQSSLFLVLIIGIWLGFGGCDSTPEQPWTATIPGEIPAFITIPPDVTLSDILEQEYIPFLDDISVSAIPMISEIEKVPKVPIILKGLLIFPSTSDSWQPVWIADASEGLVDVIAESFRRDFTQNNYSFGGYRVHKLFIGERIIFATQIHRWLIFSESSYGVEQSIRAYTGLAPAFDPSGIDINPGRLVLNTLHLPDWLKQMASVSFYPQIDGIFKGTKPSSVAVTRNDSTEQNLKHTFRGTIPLSDQKSSSLVSAFTTQNSELKLDRYISSNAASFAIFRLPPRKLITRPKDPTPLDSLLMNDDELFNRIYETLNPEFAFVTYAESGFTAEGEELYLRHLADFREFYRILREMKRDGYLEQEGNVFYARSSVLAQLIGSELCTLEEYYLTSTYKGAVIARRKGRAESVKADRSRRRVIYYEDDYLEIRQSFPEEVSALVVAHSERFMDYIQPFLSPNNYLSTITSRFDFLTLTTVLNRERTAVDMVLNTYNLNQTSLPYEERWVFPLDGAELTGNPILADIGGSSRDEVVFSTTAGNIFALATDGTIVLQTNTGTDRPIGSPIVYDWYGNNQDAIMIAAGNKVYAWNDNGQMLPQFPLELPETISAPAVVADITRDGIPELMVATADRKLHILDGRGRDLPGWPQGVNAPITTAPVLERINGIWSVWAYASNTAHAWLRNGGLRPGFPKFVNAELNGVPYFYGDLLVANAADGHLYTIGEQSIFADSLNTLAPVTTESDSAIARPDSIRKEAVYVSNSALTGTPSLQQFTVRLPADSSVVSEKMFLTMSANGSVFLINEKGQLRFTESMGQQSASNFSPYVVDLNDDNRSDIVALANFGRLYAWEAYSGKRIYTLPTTGMKYPIITDLDGDGELELIAQTREGVRSWSLTNSD